MYWGGLFLGKKLLSVLNKRKCVDYLENKKNMFSWTACAQTNIKTVMDKRCYSMDQYLFLHVLVGLLYNIQSFILWWEDEMTTYKLFSFKKKNLGEVECNLLIFLWYGCFIHTIIIYRYSFTRNISFIFNIYIYIYILYGNNSQRDCEFIHSRTNFF